MQLKLKNAEPSEPLLATGQFYLLGSDVARCCREANTSCTPDSDRTGRLESTCKRTSGFYQEVLLGFFCDLLLSCDVTVTTQGKNECL